MFEGLNAVYEENEKRGFIKLNAISLALTFGTLTFVIASLLTITVVPKLLSFLGLPGISELVNYGRWPVLLVVASLMIAVIYRFGGSSAEHAADGLSISILTPLPVESACTWTTRLLVAESSARIQSFYL